MSFFMYLHIKSGIINILIVVTVFLFTVQFQAQERKTFFIKENDPVKIVYDNQGTTLDSIVSYLLADDLERVLSWKPRVLKFNGDLDLENAILIGNYKSKFIKTYVKDTINSNFLSQSESFFTGLRKNVNNAPNFIIAGTDARGTAYGVFSISEQIGVNPWYWWADVPTIKKNEIRINATDKYSNEPSVKFRGIFLNDEDWGLQPWAAKTFEPEISDIGPKTYSKIFELLLRLKANTIWPAMHPSTKAFFHYSENPKIAKLYHIVVGTSHAEPMLRNNVDEWKKSYGKFDFKSNQETILKYWDQRVKEAKDIHGIYTVGIRGIHDSGMEGVSSTKEGAELLTTVIKKQRELLSKYNEKPINTIPQAFTVYKEVLKLYDFGIDLPQDITLVWTDDNYGYIRRLSDSLEQQGSGGSGVYYHASYWGRPHDYLWLSTTSPFLIKEEMLKAYEMNARNMWILNVGDIKPASYEMQLFLDMAYDINPFLEKRSIINHQQSFYENIFGKDNAHKITALKNSYYELAYERKPEYMGWSQTEPTTPVKATAYNPYNYGDEINLRLGYYERLGNVSDSIYKSLPVELKSTFFQLIHYPVKGAMYMNQKHLYRDLAEKYEQSNRVEANVFKDKSLAAYDSIIYITEQYNLHISNGKWNHIMSMQPRKLPVFDKPSIDISISESNPMGISYQIEGYVDKGSELPTFYKGFGDSYYIDVFLTKQGKEKWHFKNLPKYLKVSKHSGLLESDNNKYSERIKFSVDWNLISKEDNINTVFYLRVGSEIFPIKVNIQDYKEVNCNECFYEKNGFAVAYAASGFQENTRGDVVWKPVKGLGYTSSVMQAVPFKMKPLDTLHFSRNHPKLKYQFYTESITDTAKLVLAALPSHPLTKNHKVRVGVQWDNEEINIVNFETYGRSEEWKQNVLRNLAIKEMNVSLKKKGKHTLTIYMIDEGVALDFIYVKTNAETLPYSLLEETNNKIKYQ
ncbi:glycosyl hydrolase 115 family protein [Neptunitalea lumnitzerae]|uniref:Gylcosyl hydrolase 115 C-terminal domain-containing protein n=1 Tax=Neptunitalea lumnitzerae TaxID=2965509 RepID=A0ABQ5MIX0_9FLAO|nr:glycosyl hydrolase 115 family protein [Neptunitalea sp. Y10]GLB49344.1 hypothetical protein Y10_17120 [Neptunitalea sp. Y10]